MAKVPKAVKEALAREERSVGLDTTLLHWAVMGGVIAIVTQTDTPGVRGKFPPHRTIRSSLHAADRPLASVIINTETLA